MHFTTRAKSCHTSHLPSADSCVFLSVSQNNLIPHNAANGTCQRPPRAALWHVFKRRMTPSFNLMPFHPLCVGAALFPYTLFMSTTSTFTPQINWQMLCSTLGLMAPLRRQRRWYGRPHSGLCGGVVLARWRRRSKHTCIPPRGAAPLMAATDYDCHGTTDESLPPAGRLNDCPLLCPGKGIVVWGKTCEGTECDTVSLWYDGIRPFAGSQDTSTWVNSQHACSID